MRILVTGGSGLIGSAFVQVAILAGHEIAVLSRSPAPRDDVRWLVGSLADSPWSEIRSFAPQACLYGAWAETSGSNLESTDHYAWVHWSSEFLTRLSAIDVRHITVLGTCLEYKMTGQVLTEDVTPVAPLSIYAQCKNQLRIILEDENIWPQETALVWARVFNAYGPGEHRKRFMSSMAAGLSANKPILLRTPQSMRDFVYVDDVANALLMILERRFNGTINIGTGQGMTVEAVVRKLAALLRRPNLIQTPPSRDSDPLDFVVADATRLLSLGWKPKISLETGLLLLAKSLGAIA